MREAIWILHHDDPPCEARLFKCFCVECNVHPDMQSRRLYLYCPDCDVPLGSGLQCPECSEYFKKPE